MEGSSAIIVGIPHVRKADYFFRGGLVLVLLVAAFMRLWAIDRAPPGLSDDEVSHWLIVRQILSGHPAIYFTLDKGHEPFVHYLQAGMVALLGDHWLALRYPSIALGVLSVATIATLTRRLLGRRVALLTAAYLALGFWPVFYARLALRANALPLLAALAAYFFFRGFSHDTSRFLPYLISGLFFGLSFYTYTASRVLPLIMAVYLIYLITFHRRWVHNHWRGILAALAVAAIVSAPLVIWLATHRGAEQRISELRGPLDDLLAGNPASVWANLKASLGMFAFRGESWAHYNVPGRPIFDRLNGILFHIGAVFALSRWRDYRCAFLLIWLAGSLVPSVLASDAPSSIRSILGLVVTFSFPALALSWVTHLSDHLLSRLPALLLHLVLTALLAFPLLRLGFSTARDYFALWPQEPIVQFNYHADLAATARRIEELDPETPLVVTGLAVHTVYGPLLELSTQRPTEQVRACDTRQTLIIPVGDNARLLAPNVVPFDEDLLGFLLAQGARASDRPARAYREYTLPPVRTFEAMFAETVAFLPDGTPSPLPVSFNGYLALIGVKTLADRIVPGSQTVVLTAWRVESPPPAALKVFLHLFDSDGNLRAQDDRLLESPPARWTTGDLLLQKHILDLPGDLEPGSYVLSVGLYWLPDGPRLPVRNTDRITMPLKILAP